MAKATDELEANDNMIEETTIDADEQTDNETVSKPDKSAREIDYTSRQSLMLALVLLTLMAFANSLNGKFVYDDVPLIIENQTLGHWDTKTLKNIFSRDTWASFRPDLLGENPDSFYYRPVFALVLMAGHEIAGQNPVKWHLIVLLLHIVAVLICFFVTEKALLVASDMDEKRRRIIAAFIAAVFAVHPVQSESVAWIYGMVNPLSTIIMLASFYCYLSYRQKNHLLLFACGIALFAIASITKENSLALALIIAAHELFVFNRDSAWGTRFRKTMINVLPFACVLIAYLMLRYSVLGVMTGRPLNGNFPDDQSLTLIDNIRTLPALLFGYLKIILMPFNLSILYGIGYTRSIGIGNFWLPLAVVLAGMVGLIQACRKIPEASMAVIWITTPILPHLNTRAFVSEELLHDRYLYISIMGVGLLAALLLSRMVEKTQVRLNEVNITKLAAFVVMVLCLLTVVQNRHWQNPEAMWNQAAKTAPNTREVQYALGWIAEMKGDMHTAIIHYDAALQIQPDMIDALNSSALVLGRARQWEEATRRFERIVELTPEKAIARFNLAVAYAAQRRFAEAMHEQSTAISLDPDGPMADQWRTMLAQLEKLSTGQSPRQTTKN